MKPVLGSAWCHCESASVMKNPTQLCVLEVTCGQQERSAPDGLLLCRSDLGAGDCFHSVYTMTTPVDTDSLSSHAT